MRFEKKNISSSIGIEIKAPEGFSLSGDAVVKPTIKEEKKSDKELFLEMLYTQLEQLEEQKQTLVRMINKIKAELGCSGCGSKKS